MTTSGSYTFNPSLGELVLNAFARIQVLRSQLTQDHMVNSRLESNLLQQEWNNKGVNLWTVDKIVVPLVAAQTTYTVPPETVMILDAFIRQNAGSASESDTSIMPFSRTDYASISNKANQGVPTSFWFDRLISPTITLWPVPNSATPYELHYYRYRLIQDATFANAMNVEIPVLWLDAFAAGLAHRLSRLYNRNLTKDCKMDAVEAFDIAATQNTENVQMNITPGLSGYYR